MRYLKYAALFGLLAFGFTGSAKAQVRVAMGVGPVYGAVYGPPVCAYGYYDYYPYACAPYGYYGPDWFVNGIFIGAGPWYHGYYGRGFYPRGYYGRGYYGRPYYGRGGYYGRGYYARPGYGSYGRGFANHPGSAYHARGSRGFSGGNGFHAGGGFRSGGGGGFHGGGHR